MARIETTLDGNKKQQTASGVKQGLKVCLLRFYGKAATTINEAWQAEGNFSISMSKTIYRFQ